MKRVLLALFAIGLAQNGYCGWKDALKEVAKQVAEQSTQTQPQAASSRQAPTQQEPLSYEEGLRKVEQEEQDQKRMLEQKNPLPFQVNLDDPLMKQGVWKDSRTGLLWARCLVGQKWTGTSCNGNSKSVAPDDPYSTQTDVWVKAMVIADDWSYGGYDDWRLPSMEELAGLLNCSGSALGWDESSGTDSYPNDNGATKKIHSKCENGYPIIGTSEIFPGWTTEDKVLASNTNQEKGWYVQSGNGVSSTIWGDSGNKYFRVLAVRGGNAPSFYLSKLSEAKSLNAKKTANESAKMAEKKAKENSELAANKAAQEEKGRKIAIFSKKNGKPDVEVSIETNPNYGTLIFNIQAIANQATIWKVSVNRGNCDLPVGTAKDIDRTIKLKFGQAYRGFSNNCRMQNVREIEVITENGKFVFNF